MKIGELARATGTRIETIRFYEREGLLPAAERTEANYRIYTEAHVQRLAFVRHCRSLDMALEEIRVLLHFKDSPGEDCGAVNALLDAHIGHVADRVQELQRLEQELRRLRAQCQAIQASSLCGILSELAQGAGSDQASSAPGATDHVPGASCPCPRS
ncbi:Cd(II)/Pb(II)-responsive transcriptional regulator [Niveibacterium terrae]|uniref:Cd(II)/Pb(II)-responsive transcriptional regulator n=1 Tax=Niveibacterium terrae TaxID=3373598 RepID=UPI003A92F43F